MRNSAGDRDIENSFTLYSDRPRHCGLNDALAPPPLLGASVHHLSPVKCQPQHKSSGICKLASTPLACQWRRISVGKEFVKKNKIHEEFLVFVMLLVLICWWVWQVTLSFLTELLPAFLAMSLSFLSPPDLSALDFPLLFFIFFCSNSWKKKVGFNLKQTKMSASALPPDPKIVRSQWTRVWCCTNM